jgi:hypothetical protein
MGKVAGWILLDANVFCLLVIIYMNKFDLSALATYSVLIGWFIYVTANVGCCRHEVCRGCLWHVSLTWYPLICPFQYFVVSTWHSGFWTDIFNAIDVIGIFTVCLTSEDFTEHLLKIKPLKLIVTDDAQVHLTPVSQFKVRECRFEPTW